MAKFDGNHTLAKFDGNNTLDQTDGKLYFGKFVWSILWKKWGLLDELVVIKNVGGAARYVWNNYGARARVVFSEA